MRTDQRETLPPAPQGPDPWPSPLRAYIRREGCVRLALPLAELPPLPVAEHAAAAHAADRLAHGGAVAAAYEPAERLTAWVADALALWDLGAGLGRWLDCHTCTLTAGVWLAMTIDSDYGYDLARASMRYALAEFTAQRCALGGQGTGSVLHEPAAAARARGAPVAYLRASPIAADDLAYTLSRLAARDRGE